ncbi:Oxidase ustYa [Cladobotryum mycophilum]|uniref:Oxidase ustYa n=1 Tax=Cladobotryum mycophilum TaxID=491253 RepID=A0ABR0SZV2_9HYPO
MAHYEKVSQEESEIESAFSEEDTSLKGEVAYNQRQNTAKNQSKCIAIYFYLLTMTVLSFIGMTILHEYYSSGPVPILRATKTVFQKDALMASESSPESDAAWDNLLPGKSTTPALPQASSSKLTQDGRGFVLVKKPEKYNLGPGIPTEGGPDRYSISMFHQLHCLGMVRESYYAGTQGRKAHVSSEDGLSNTQMEHSRRQHIGHCFDYLRQAIMCAGDMTLESAETSPDGKVRASVDGWGIEHKCKSWNDAIEWTLQHKAPHNHTGIA